MTRKLFPFLAVGCILLVSSACQKDELTVVSTAPYHTCGMRAIALNVDSLIQEYGGGWGDVPDQHFTFCSCDTVLLTAVNIQDPWYFARWYFGNWPYETNHWEPVLDTITTATFVTLDVHSDATPPEPDHLHIRVHLHEQDCK